MGEGAHRHISRGTHVGVRLRLCGMAVADVARWRSLVEAQVVYMDTWTQRGLDGHLPG